MVTVASSPSPQTVAKPVTPEPKATSSDSKTPTPDKSPKLVDLNKATEAELQEISGVGEAYSKKIIEGRPYKSIDDLSKTGIPAATVDKIKPQVTVGGAVAPPAKGMVWVNLETKLYHHESSRWYGNTKSGKYMTEAEAEKAGYKARSNSVASSHSVFGQPPALPGGFLMSLPQPNNVGWVRLSRRNPPFLFEHGYPRFSNVGRAAARGTHGHAHPSPPQLPPSRYQQSKPAPHLPAPESRSPHSPDHAAQSTTRAQPPQTQSPTTTPESNNASAT